MFVQIHIYIYICSSWLVLFVIPILSEGRLWLFSTFDAKSSILRVSVYLQIFHYMFVILDSDFLQIYSQSSSFEVISRCDVS